MKKAVSALFLIVFCLFTAAYAEESITDIAANVREKIDIPDAYTDFNSYVDVGNNLNYVLSWSGGAAGNGGAITVVVDSSMRIISLNQYKYGKYSGNNRLSDIDYNAAVSLAEGYVSSISPELYDSVKVFMQDNYIVKNSERYNVLFYRYENELPCFDNYITVSVDAYTHQPMEYNVVWGDYTKAASADGLISRETALQLYYKSIGIELSYKKYNGAIKLVYSTNSDGCSFVNAYTQNIVSTGLAPGAASQNYRKQDGITVSYTEQPATPDKLFLGTDDRLRRNPYFIITSDYELNGVTFLNDDYNSSFVKAEYSNFQNNTIEAVINTSNGEIYGYYAPQIPTEVSKRLSDSVCKKIAEDFCRQYIKSFYSECKQAKGLVTSGGNYKILFSRYVNGIPFNENGIEIEIDRANGKLLRVTVRRDNAEFPLSIPDIAEHEAFETLAKQVGFGAYYVPFKSSDGEQLRAVYGFYPTYPLFVDGTNGSLCTSDGDCYSIIKTPNYTDISGHKSEQQISTIALANIFRPNTEEYYPEQEITAQEFADMCRATFNSDYTPENPQTHITHEEAVEIIINQLGYGKIAYYDDTYRTDFIDEGFITPSRLGCAAIAKGLKLINGNAFLPHQNCTRAYAAELIYNIIG